MPSEAVAKAIYQLEYRGLDQVERATAALDRNAAAVDRNVVVNEKLTRATRASEAGFARLMGRLDPQIREQQRYQRTLEQITRYESEGIIGANERSRAVALAAQRYEMATAALSRHAAANQNLSRSTGLAAHQMQNLGFQLNDIVSGLAMGVSPFQILAQQGGQVYQVMSMAEGGVGGALRGIKEQIAGLLTPGRLLVAGFLAASGAAYGLYRVLASDGKSAEERLAEHTRLLGLVKESYKGAADEAARWAAEIGKATTLQAQSSLGQLQEQLRRQAEQIAATVGRRTAGGTLDIGIGDFAGEGMIRGGLEVEERYRAFARAIDEFNASIARGAPDVKRFREEVAAIGLASPALADTASKLLEVSQGAADMQGKVAQAEAMLRLLTGAASDADRALLGLSASMKAMETFGENLQKLTGMAGKEFGIASRLREADDAFRRARAALEQAEIGTAEYVTKLDALKRAHAAALGEISKKETSAYDTLVQRTKDRIEELEFEARTAGMTANAVLVLKTAHDLERAAKTANKTVTAEQREEWRKYGEAVADATRRLAEAKLQSDIVFERSQIGRSETDQRIAERLRAIYGNDLTGAQAQFLAQQMRINEELKAAKDIAADLFTSLLSGLRSSEGALRSVGSVLTRLFDRLATAGFNQLVGGLLTGGGLNLGSIFNIGRAANDNISPARFEELMGNGVARGIERVSAASPLNIVPTQAAGGLGRGALGAGLMGIAALGGAYAGGVQSQSPTMGALSGVLGGAMGGLALGTQIGAIGGPLGMAIGAVIGGLVGWLGGSSGRRQAERARQQQAQADWQAMRPQVQDLNDRLAGRPVGSVTRSQREALESVTQASTAAYKAGDFRAVAELQRNYQEFVQRTTREFAASFGDMLGALSSGLGPNSPLMAARANVVQMAEELKGFIADAEKLTGRTGEARKAAQDYALTLLTGVEPLTEVQKQLMTIDGTAKQLQISLVELGLSSEEAARRIQDGVATAIKKLREKFVDDIERQINDALGRGYVNQIGDVIKNVAKLREDALKLGADPALIERYYRVQLQKIIDDAQLTGESFEDLVKLFPQLRHLVHEFIAELDPAVLRQRRQSFQDRLFAALVDTSTLEGALAAFDRQAQREREEEIKAGGLALAELERALAAERLNIVKEFNDRAVEEQKRATEEAAAFIAGLTRDIQKYLATLRTGADSPLAPSQRLAVAQANYQAQLALAQTGDRNAISSITQYSSTLIDAAKAFFGSSAGFQSVFNQVLGELEALPGIVASADPIVNAIEEQTQVIQEQTAELERHKALLDLIERSTDSTDTNIEIAKNLLNTSQQIATSSNSLLNTTTQFLNTATALLDQIKGLNSTASAQLALLNSQYTQTSTIIAVDKVGNVLVQNNILTALNKIVWNTYATARNTGLIGIDNTQNNRVAGVYAAGGWVTGGVPGRDSVNAMLTPGEFVVREPVARLFRRELQDLNAGGGMPANDNGAMVQELRQLRAEVRRLEAQLDRVARTTAAGAEHVAETVSGTVKETMGRKSIDERQAAARPARRKA